jgi:hypothetical protein
MALTKPRAYQIFDLDYKQSVRVLTAADVTLSGSAPNSVDGINLSQNDRVLVKSQNTASQNGLYIVTTVGTGSNGTWARSVDGNETGEIQAGMIVMVTEGNTYKDTQWKLVTNDPIVIGVTALTFELNTSTSSINNGNTNVTIGELGGNVAVSVGGTANVAVFTATGLTANNIATDGNLVVGNNLVVNGNLTYINITDLNVEDPIIGLGRGANNTPLTTNDGKDRGEQLWYYTTEELSAFIGYDNSAGKLIAAANVSISNEIVTVNNYGTLAVGTLEGTTVSATANIVGGNITTGGLITATGNLAGNYILGNGALLTGLPAGYANSNVTAYLSSGTVSTNILTTAAVSATGNVNGGNVLVAGLISATGTITSSANITGGNVLTGGLVSATGNITGNYILGNGSQLTGLPESYSNANVTSLLAAFGSNTISTTGTITAGNVTGGNIRTAGLISATGKLDVGGQITSTGAGNADTNGGQIFLNGATNNRIDWNTNGIGAPEYTTRSVGAKVVLYPSIGGSSTDYALGVEAGALWSGIPGYDGGQFFKWYGGNVLVASLSGTGVFSATGDITSVANITGGNILTAGAITATGNITGNYFLGNGSQLTGLPSTYTDANVTTLLANLGSNVISGTGNITTTANISGNYILGNGSQLTGLPATYGNADVVALLANFGSNAVSTTGNVTAGNFVTSGLISATGAITSLANITGGNILTGGLISAAGNFTAGNVLSSGAISAGGNVNAVTVIATNLTGTLTTAAQTNITLLGTLSSLSVTGNVQGGNLRTVGLISAAGNVLGGNLIAGGNVEAGNILTTGTVSAAGNVTGNYFIGNGSQLTGISASSNAISNGNSNVVIATANGNINLYTNGQDTVEVSPGELTVYGVFSNPKTITSNVVIGPNINSMLIGPISVDPANNIFVPNGSTLNII